MNREQDGIEIISEDNNLRAVAVGFFSQSLDITKNINIRPYKKGWPSIYDEIPEYIRLLKRFRKMRIVILIDFDTDKNRYEKFMQKVDEEVQDRFFILGPFHDVEQLKLCCHAKSFENLGALLEQDAKTKNLPQSRWQCEELKNILPEAQRLCDNVKSFFWL